MGHWRPESKDRFRRPAPATWRKPCSTFWKRRKSRIAGCWRTGQRSTRRLGVVSSNWIAAPESRKTNWTHTWLNSKLSRNEAALHSLAGGRARSCPSLAVREKESQPATPGMGHWRKDLTDEPVKFFSYS